MTLQTLALAGAVRRDAARSADAQRGRRATSTSPAARSRIGAARGDDARALRVRQREVARTTSTLAPFAIARRCVTNGEFAAFVDDGGYARPRVVGGRGSRAGATAPTRRAPAYWRRGDGGWRGAAVRSLAAARAGAQPVAARQRVRGGSVLRVGRPAAADRSGVGNAPRDGAAYARRRSGNGPRRRFAPYPGFAADPYADYSQPWFGDHRVLRGRLVGDATAARRIRDSATSTGPNATTCSSGFRTCALALELVAPQQTLRNTHVARAVGDGRSFPHACRAGVASRQRTPALPRRAQSRTKRARRRSLEVRCLKPTDIAQPDYFHKVVDCQWACPAHTPVPEYIRLIAAGPLRRRVPGQLEVERLSRHSRPHLRPPVRARVPPRPRRGGRRHEEERSPSRSRSAA